MTAVILRRRRRNSAHSIHCAVGHVLSERERIRERDPDSPRVKPTLPRVTLLGGNNNLKFVRRRR
jgi:hypothetical protein